jgi:hypothetical protein
MMRAVLLRQRLAKAIQYLFDGIFVFDDVQQQ